MSEPDALATVTRAVARARGPEREPARLRAVHPPDLSWSVAIGIAPVVVGRTASEDGVRPLAHETVSRRHLELAWDDARGGHAGRDLGSHNGTRIDGIDLGDEPRPLVDGSVVMIGDVCLVYERGEAGDDVAPHVSAIPGRSPAAGRLRAAIAKAAADPSPVLLVGETGTGKEFVAREVHRLSGRGGPLVAVNCSALSAPIVDSQLFGHVKGAFTGATSDQPGLFRAADTGTLFLDEIGEMPLELQPKLLRALQEGEVQPVGSTRTITVDVRVIAATNRSLEHAIESGAFRRDLHARLALWPIAVPSLRERRGDVLAWVERLHTAWCERRATQAELRLAPEAAEAILLFAWPSNLRELDRLVHDLASAAASPRIELDALPSWLRDATAGDAPPSATRGDADMARDGKRPLPTREEFVAAFERLDGNVRAMAKHFGRDRRQIYRWIESHGLADRRGRRD